MVNRVSALVESVTAKEASAIAAIRERVNTSGLWAMRESRLEVKLWEDRQAMVEEQCAM
ncbi:hypothetical protein [Spirosoma lituiforme]